MYVKAQPPLKHIICFIEKIDMPNMITLEKITTREGEVINIIEESCNAYREIGTILLHDRRGARVEAFEDDYRGMKMVIMREIYKRWIRENEHHTWKTLTECLLHIVLSSTSDFLHHQSQNKVPFHIHIHNTSE